MRLSKLLIGAVAVAVVGAGATTVLTGGFPTSRDTHPPCQELPTAAEATAALARNQALADDIEALGDSISVGVGSPCPEEQERALVQVTYGSRSERDAVGNLLARRDGFGVPVHLVRH